MKSQTRHKTNINVTSTSTQKTSLRSHTRPKPLAKTTKQSKTSPSTRLIRKLSTIPTPDNNTPTTPSSSSPTSATPTPTPPPTQTHTDPTTPSPPKFTLIRSDKVPLSQRQIQPKRRRVVVTGIGVVSPLGNDLHQVYDSILNANSAIKAIDTPDLAKLNLQTKSYAPVGNVPEIDNPDIIPRNLKQVLSRHQVYAMVATHNAMKQAGLIKPKVDGEGEGSEGNVGSNGQNGQNSTPIQTTTTSTSDPPSTPSQPKCQQGHEELCDLCEDEPECVYQRNSSDRFGVCIGSSIGCVEEIGSAHVKVQDKGGKGAGAYSLPKLLVNLAAGHLTQLHEARALTHTVSTACATGAHAIGDATAFIRDDKADIIIAGGTETGVSPLSLALFNRIHALSRQAVNTSGGPFTSQRDGFVMGEGAAVLVLEEAEHAIKRGANIICEVLGYGLSSDAHHITQPHRLGRGAYMAMENALKDAGIEMGSVDYVNAHATSTPIGDIAEASAIRALTQVHYNKRKEKRMARIKARAEVQKQQQQQQKQQQQEKQQQQQQAE